MPITSKCPYCSLHFKAPDELAGRVVSCPKCAEDITIPIKASAKKRSTRQLKKTIMKHKTDRSS